MNALKIIIADDHTLFREGLEQALQRLLPSATIFLVSNGVQVVNLLKSKIVDLIFVDVQLACQEETEMIRSIRKTDDEVKIVAISMIQDSALVMKIMEAGANGYLYKNTKKCELLHLIEVVLGGDQYFSEEIAYSQATVGSDTTAPVNGNEGHHVLSDREIEILVLICNQFSSREIADRLHVTEKTVETHRNHLMSKTQSKNVVGLTMFAIDQGYFLPELNKKG